MSSPPSCALKHRHWSLARGEGEGHAESEQEEQDSSASRARPRGGSNRRSGGAGSPRRGTATQGKAKDRGAVIRGDDKKIVSLDDGSGALINGDDKVIVPWTGEYYAFADYYRQAYAQDVLAGNDKAIVPAPSTFDWGDALVGAGATFGLMLLLGGAALGTRHVRPTTA